MSEQKELKLDPKCGKEFNDALRKLLDTEETIRDIAKISKKAMSLMETILDAEQCVCDGDITFCTSCAIDEVLGKVWSIFNLAEWVDNH